MTAVEQIGASTDLETLVRFVPLAGRRVIDVGCGDGTLALSLAERGAKVLGVEPDPRRAQMNRELPAKDGVTLVEGSAQTLPAEDGSADVVIFAKSLHHVPAAEMARALQEAKRVLDSGEGILYVFEPVMAGSYSQLIRLFDDETEARQSAAAALAKTAAALFQTELEIHYEVTVRFEDFDAFVRRFAGLTYCRYRREDLESAPVRACFETGLVEDGYHFDQPMCANLFTGTSL